MEISLIRQRMGQILLTALKEDKKQIAKILIEGGANISTNKNSIIKKIINLGYLDILKYLVKIGININDTQSKDYVNPLLLSIKLNRVEISEYLLMLKENSNYVFDISNGNEFLICVENKNMHLVKYFIERGIDLNICNIYDENALYIALKNSDKEMADYLISQCHPDGTAKIEINKNGLYILRNRINNGDIDAVNFLLDKGIDINISDKSGITALEIAIQCKQMEIAKLIITKRPLGHPNACDVNVSDGYILFDAIERKDIEFVKLLLTNGADITIKNLKALDKAVTVGDENMVRLLVEHINQVIDR